MTQKLRLDPWIEGYLDYLRDVKKLKHASVKDFRSAFHRVCDFMENIGRICRYGSVLYRTSWRG